MRRLPFDGLLPALLAGLALTWLPPATRGQGELEKVNFETVDEVELKGTFYPSDQGTKAPCVLLLHNVGGSSHDPGWDELAKQLQKKGYAVLSFDFRGHGGSTTVSPAFWKVSSNQLIKGGSAKKKEINQKDFLPNYLPYLLNDIAAARRFLDQKNDDQKCNASNLILIGAQEGATLGAMWLAAEWQRRPPRVQGGGAQPAFGQDVAAGIWITFSPTLGKVATKAAKWITPLRDKTPMAFLYGEDDKRAASVATELCDQILKIDTPPRPKYTGAKAIKGKGVGNELLQKSAETDEKILNYLTNVLDARGDQTWVNRDTKRAKFEFVPLKQFFK